ncbi:MAG: hypothetical protein Aurels2KO_40500 [Aureliella sp.]
MDGRALEPLESYYSVIVPKEDELDRIDIAAKNWKEPPEAAVGWWKCKMPAAGARKLKAAPTGVLLDTLSDLVERPGQESLAYFLSLLLVRRGTLIEEEHTVLAVGDPNAVEESGRLSVASEEPVDESTEAADSDGQEAAKQDAVTEYWQLVCKADGRSWNVPVTAPSGQEMVAIEEQLNKLLFTEQ